MDFPFLDMRLMREKVRERERKIENEWCVCVCALV